MKSIMQTEKECYICKTKQDLHKHHIYFGNPRRQISEENGFTVWLCGNHHNMMPDSAHHNKVIDKALKEECQRVFEKTHSRKEFFDLIGRNYLEDDVYEDEPCIPD